MKKIYTSSGVEILVDDDDYEVLSSTKWYIQSAGYAHGDVYGKKVLMHRYIMNFPEGLEIDHMNGDKLDNRKSNLRVCTRSQNEFNKKITSRNKTGVKGVCFDEKHKKYKAQIYVNNTCVWLGRYETIEEAKKVYDEKAKEIYGDFA